jgi:hypothetical protein
LEVCVRDRSILTLTLTPRLKAQIAASQHPKGIETFKMLFSLADVKKGPFRFNLVAV